jgi:hypothetical protein
VAQCHKRSEGKLWANQNRWGRRKIRQTPAMDDEDALVELWKGTGARVTERRSYEWKIAFGLWTAQLLTVGLLFNNASEFDRNNWLFLGLYLGAGLLLTALHACYVFGFVVGRNKYESELARAYERDLHAALGTSISWNTKTWFEKAPAQLYNSANFLSVGVTIFLALVGPIAIAFL